MTFLSPESVIASSYRTDNRHFTVATSQAASLILRLLVNITCADSQAPDQSANPLAWSGSYNVRLFVKKSINGLSADIATLGKDFENAQPDPEMYCPYIALFLAG